MKDNPLPLIVISSAATYVRHIENVLRQSILRNSSYLTIQIIILDNMSRSRSPEPRGAEKSAPGGDNARSDRRQSRSRSRSRDRGGGRDRRDDRPSSRVYVGNLPGDVSKREVRLSPM